MAPIDVEVALVVVVRCALKVTLSLARAGSKFVPLMVTAAPGTPMKGVKLVIVGAPSTPLVVTVKEAPVVAEVAPTVTEIGPVVAPVGTVATSWVVVAEVTVAVVPLNLTVF